MFSETKTATVASCVANLAKTIMGTGILALPGAFRGCGLAWGLLFTVITGALATFSLFLLSELVPLGGQHPTLNGIATRAAGKFGGVLVDVSVLCNTFGAATSYLIIASTSVQSVLGSQDAAPRWFFVLASVVVVTPLCFLRRVDLLRFTSSLAVFALMLLTLMILLFAMPWGEQSFFEPCRKRVDCHGDVVMTTAPLDVVKQFVIFTNAYTCHHAMVPICAELERPTRSRKIAVIAGAIGITSTLFLCVGTAGYLTFGSNVTSDILLSYPDDSVLVSAARVGIIVDVLTTYPLQVFFSRISIANLYKALNCCGHAPHTPWTGHARTGCFIVEPLPVLSALAFMASTTSVALVVSDLGIVADLTGATGATMIGYIAPGFVYALLAARAGTTCGEGSRPLILEEGAESAAGCADISALRRGSLLQVGAFKLFVLGCIIVPLAVTLALLK